MGALGTGWKNVTIPVQVKKAFRFVGWLFLLLGLLLCLLGVLCLPDGGLLFALPYFFLIPGIALTASGGLLALLTRVLKTGDKRIDVARQMNPGECNESHSI
jgi:vacuolar-type H+-ATPase subunit I/STV1